MSEAASQQVKFRDRPTQHVFGIAVLFGCVLGINIGRHILQTMADTLDWSDFQLRVAYLCLVVMSMPFSGFAIIRLKDRVLNLTYLVLVSMSLVVESLPLFRDGAGLSALPSQLVGVVALGLLGFLIYRMIALMVASSQRQLLARLAWATSHRVGADYLKGLVSTIVSTLEMPVACLSEISPDTKDEAIIASATIPDLLLPVELTPGHCTHLQESDLQTLLPGYHPTQIPLQDAEGQVLGHLTLFCADDEGVSPGVASILEIFSSRASAEIQRIQADQKSNEMEQRMFQAQTLESLGVLAGGIAHDFNNLLQAIQSFTTIAESSDLRAHSRHTAFRQIDSAVEKGAMLCGRLLAYAGRRPRQDQVCDLNRVVAEIADILSAARPNCSIHCRLSREPQLVWGDVAQLSQVVMNLLTNGAEALPAEGGCVQVTTLSGEAADREPLASRLNPASQSPLILLKVSDNGCGIPSEVLPRIFDPFYSRKGSGRGIGLSSVARMVKDHHGDLTVSSQPGEGTTFLVGFPVSRRPLPEPVLSSPPPQEVVTPLNSGLNILVVDDDDLVRQSTLNLLTGTNASATGAASGAEAIDLCCRSGRRFDLIILDQTMPGLSGMETCRRLRAEGYETPVILMSGYFENGVCEELSQVRFLGKPCSRKELLQTVGELTDGAVTLSVPGSHRMDHAHAATEHVLAAASSLSSDA